MIQFYLSIISVYVLDLLTKMLVRQKMPLGMEIPVAPFFSLTHVTNTGIAFGMFQNLNALFLILGVVVSGVIFWIGLRSYSQDRFSSLVLAMVLGGALGNLTDRIFFGQVTDFLDFYIGVHHWPAFNVADSAISVGAVLLLIRSLKGGDPSFPRRRESSS